MELPTERATFRWKGVLAIALGGAGEATIMGLGPSAGATRVETPTTIVLASGGPAPALAEAELLPLLDGLRSAWPDATVESTREVVDDRADHVDLSGGLGATTYQATIYRRFEARELVDLERLRSERGEAWLGADDGDLTSVYFHSHDGMGVWVGVTVPRGSEPVSVADVLARAGLADVPAVRSLAADQG